MPQQDILIKNNTRLDVEDEAAESSQIQKRFVEVKKQTSVDLKSIQGEARILKNIGIVDNMHKIRLELEEARKNVDAEKLVKLGNQNDARFIKELEDNESAAGDKADNYNDFFRLNDLEYESEEDLLEETALKSYDEHQRNEQDLETSVRQDQVKKDELLQKQRSTEYCCLVWGMQLEQTKNANYNVTEEQNFNLDQIVVS